MSSSLSPGEGEFNVDGAPRYDLGGPRRWVLSHLGRYRRFLLAFLVCSTLSNGAVSLASVLTGRIAGELLQPGGGALLQTCALLLVLLVLGAAANLGGAFSGENIAKGVQGATLRHRQDRARHLPVRAQHRR